MIRIFENMEEYNTFTHNGKNMVSGDLYWVKENKRAFFLTNNIDGEVTSYDMMGEIPEGYIQPSGNIAITENGDVDVTQYATASVDVPIPDGYIVPSGNKEITANGTNIDVTNYATASVDVPIPDGYIQPSGTIEITENGEGIDVTNYATATVNVPSTGGGNEDLINLIEGDITTLNIPDGTTKIGKYAFYQCSGLTDVTIPDGVTSIGGYAFAYSGLTTVTIPSSVNYIDEYAFAYCSSLAAIKVLATTPPDIRKFALGDPGNCQILVHGASLDVYKNASNWSNYANYIYSIEGEIATQPDGPEIGGGEGPEIGGEGPEIEIN